MSRELPPIMAPLRLAIVTSRFWPFYDDASSHLLRLAESLLEIGHQVTVVTPQWKQAWPPQITIGNVPVTRLPSAPRGGWSTLRWMYALRNWLRDAAVGMDALLVNGLRHEAYVATGCAPSLRTKVLLLATDGDLAWQRTATFGNRIIQRCKQATSILASGPALVDELTAAGYPIASISLVPRAVPLPRERSPKLQVDARAALAAANYDLVTTDSTSVAIAVGRLDVEHRFGDLVRAWRMVTARRSGARLWIVGDGPERDNLYRQISDLDQRFRVLIPGTFDGLNDLLQAADLMLVPASRTAPTLAVLQAAAAGVPVIAADSAGMRRSMTDGCLLYPQGDTKSLAAKVLQLLENPAEGIALGAAARAKARLGPTPADEAAQYASLIRQL